MAENFIGELIASERIRRGWRFGDLARACGAMAPKQVSKTSQRLVLFEREGVRDRRLLQKVIVALALDPQLVVELLDRQHARELEEWNRWADEPVEIELHVRPFAGFWYRHELPEEIAADELLVIDFAKQMTANRDELCAVVVVNRRRSVSIARGEVVATMKAKPNVAMKPFVVIGGQRVVFEAKR